MTPDMAALTGAYAVNALTGDELAAFEQHLATCAECAREVRELRETAARLGVAAATAPPEDLKRRVLDEAARTRQEPPKVSPLRTTAKRRTSWATRLSAAAAVAGIVLAGTFGVITVRERQEADALHQRMEQAEAHHAAMAEVMSSPDARMLSTTSGHMQATTVVSHRMGKALFMGKGIGAPPDRQTYQAWFISRSGMTSAGLLQQDPAGMTTLVAPMPSDADRLCITVEPAGGSAHPTSQPMLMTGMPT